MHRIERRAQVRPACLYMNSRDHGENLRSTPGLAESTAQYFLKNSATGQEFRPDSTKEYRETVSWSRPHGLSLSHPVYKNVGLPEAELMNVQFL